MRRFCDNYKGYIESFGILICQKDCGQLDNVGLICGDEKKEVKKVLVCLDITFEVIDEAIKNNADLIISHHPLFIIAIKNVTAYSLEGNKLIKLIKNDIGAICMHTNFDYANDGVNDALADTIGLINKKILKISHSDIL